MNFFIWIDTFFVLLCFPHILFTLFLPFLPPSSSHLSRLVLILSSLAVAEAIASNSSGVSVSSPAGPGDVLTARYRRVSGRPIVKAKTWYPGIAKLCQKWVINVVYHSLVFFSWKTKSQGLEWRPEGVGVAFPTKTDLPEIKACFRNMLCIMHLHASEYLSNLTKTNSRKP